MFFFLHWHGAFGVSDRLVRVFTQTLGSPSLVASPGLRFLGYSPNVPVIECLRNALDSMSESDMIESQETEVTNKEANQKQNQLETWQSIYNVHTFPRETVYIIASYLISGVVHMNSYTHVKLLPSSSPVRLL